MADDTSEPPGWPFDGASTPATPPPGAPRFEPPAPAAPPPSQPPQPSYQPPPPAPGYAPPPSQPPQPGYAPPPPPGQPPQPGYKPPPPAQPYAAPYEPPTPNQPPPPQQYVPPPGWAPTAPPKKNRKPLWITLGVIFAVLALGIGSCTIWFVGTVKAPVDEANRFLAAIDQGDYATAAAMTDPSCNAGMSAGSLEEVFGGDDISYNLNNSSVVNSSATVRGSFSQGSLSLRNVTVTLQNRDGWRVCNFFRE